MGLHVVLNANIDEYYCSSTQSAGFKILLHSPVEKPLISNYGILVSPGVETRLIVQPRFGTASHRLRNIEVKKRVCLFADEKNLTYFR